MAEAMILLGDSAAVKCTPLNTAGVSMRTGNQQIVDGLRFHSHCRDYNQSTVDPRDACIMANRILASMGLDLCSSCPNSDVHTDPILQTILAETIEA